MFSKFGKVLTYQFHILMSKDEILSPSRPGRLPKKVKKHKAFALPDSVIETPNEKPSLSILAKQKKTHMFRSQSREEFYKTTSPKLLAPPVGYYNCNYSYISKSPKSAVFKQRTKTQSRVQPSNIENPDTFTKYNPQKRVSSVSFQKQLSRKNIFVKDLNEKRFLSYNCMPEVCSNYKRVGTPDISRTKGRDELIKSPIHLNSYRPDFKLIKEDLGKVHEFEKYSTRKPLFEEKEDLRSYDVKWDGIEKKIYAADFSKGSVKSKEVSVYLSNDHSQNFK